MTLPPDQLARAESFLSPKELDAVRKLGNGPTSRLSPATAAQLFALYLQGYDTDEIVRMNPNYGSQGLGLIARARVEYNWDEERDRHVRSLMATIRSTVEKVTLEGVQFASDGMAVYHKLVGDRFRSFLQSGKPDDLGDLRDMSFKTYKDFVTLLQTLTGQDAEKKQRASQPPVSIHATGNVTVEASRAPSLSDDAPVASEDALTVLKFLGKK